MGSALSLRAEFVYRKINTDYLDDVHSLYYIDPTLYANYFTGAKLTNALLLNNREYELDPSYPSITHERGNPDNKDAFFTFNVKIGYTFGRQKIRR